MEDMAMWRFLALGLVWVAYLVALAIVVFSGQPPETVKEVLGGGAVVAALMSFLIIFFFD